MTEMLAWSILVGTGATALTDEWALARRSLFGIPLPDFGLVGRWIAHMRSGRFRHESIAAAGAVRGELLVGWVAHYLIGIAYAGILLAICGLDWMRAPRLMPALLVGLATMVAPFFLMQPGMGAGIAASRTPRPNAARLQTLVTHSVFGFGLYASGWLLNRVFLG